MGVARRSAVNDRTTLTDADPGARRAALGCDTRPEAPRPNGFPGGCESAALEICKAWPTNQPGIPDSAPWKALLYCSLLALEYGHAVNGEDVVRERNVWGALTGSCHGVSAKDQR